MNLGRRQRWTALGLLCLGTVLVGVQVRARLSPSAHSDAVFHIPYVDEEPNFDGELAEDMWRNHARAAKGFLDSSGHVAAPFSDVHLAWRGDELLVGLYAADFDVRTTPSSDKANAVDDADRFLIEFRVDDRIYRTFIDPAGAPIEAPCDKSESCVRAANWVSRLRIGHDSDGTLNNSADFDEEWMLEIGVPFSAIGLSDEPGTRFDARFARCDVPRSRVPVCGSFPARDHSMAFVLDR